MLNYGHCFGHAIESSTDFAISHGQAVVVGMIIANKEAMKRGLLSKENEKYIREKVLEPVLKVKIPDIDIANITSFSVSDEAEIYIILFSAFWTTSEMYQP